MFANVNAIQLLVIFYFFLSLRNTFKSMALSYSFLCKIFFFLDCKFAVALNVKLYQIVPSCKILLWGKLTRRKASLILISLTENFVIIITTNDVA